MTQGWHESGWESGPGLARSVRRYWWIVVVGALLGALLGLGVAALQDTRYAASTQLLLRTPSTQGVLGEEIDDVDPERHVVNQAQRVMSTAVLRRAANDLGVDVEQLRREVEAEAAIEADAITITAEAATAELSAETADTVAAAYQDVVRRDTLEAAEVIVSELADSVEELRARLAVLEEQLADDPGNPVLRGELEAVLQQVGALEARIEQVTVNASLRGSGVEYVEPAQTPLKPAKPQPIRDAALGMLFGVFAATALAWRLEGRRQKVDEVGDPAAVLGAPLLGAVPTFAEIGVEGQIPMISAPRSAAAEAYHLAALSLLASVPDDEEQGTVILVTSAEPGDGKTVTALNLGIASRFDDSGVILLDADARMRGLSRLAERADAVGLKELHEADNALTWYEFRHDLDGVDDVEIVPVGGEIDDPPAFFQSAGFARVVQRLRDHARIVIIDSPPLLAVADTLAVARHVDGVVLVVAKGTRLEALEETRRQLAFIDAPLLGYIVNRADVRSAPYASYAYEGPAQPTSSRRKESTGATDV